MFHLNVRSKILSLVFLFSGVIIATSIGSALSSQSVSSKLQSVSSQSLDLLHNLERSRQLLLQQSVEFERGFFQVSIAKSMGGYGIEQVEESAQKFTNYTSELLASIENVKATLSNMPDTDSLAPILEQIALLEEQQATFLEASTTTYEWWIKLKTLQANKARRVADASLVSINEQMESILTAIDDYTLQVTEQQNQQLNTTIYTSAAISGALIIAGVIISLLIVNGICGPLKRAVMRAESIAAGQLSQEQNTPTRKDEIGLLEAAMNKLESQLSGILHDVAQSSNMLTEAAHHLNKVTGESSQMVDQQKAETDQISQAVQEIQSTAVHVSESTTQASQAAHDAETAAHEGSHLVSETIASIESLSSEISKSSQTINELQTNTDEISGILNVILGIAEQTNLLALNAAIEAARAGEQGRGFAVVADEVRHLAKNTQDATQKIEQMIAVLQTGTASAVSAMTASLQRSEQVVEQVKHEESALQNINQSTAKIRDMNDQISATAEEQATVTAEVGNNIQNITSIAAKTTESIHSISDSAEQLAKLASQLSNKVSYFKV
ncbi:methyl-accepting chemotaxis protein [Marinomonas epiphytica]